NLKLTVVPVSVLISVWMTLISTGILSGSSVNNFFFFLSVSLTGTGFCAETDTETNSAIRQVPGSNRYFMGYLLNEINGFLTGNRVFSVAVFSGDGSTNILKNF